MKLTKAEAMMANLPSLRRYDLYTKRDAAPVTIADMTVEQRREYDRRKRAESRKRQKESAAAGAIEPSLPNIRDALADAALMLLAVDGPGSQEIRNALARVFEARPGVVLSVEADVRRGRLKPKLLKP
jgi:hypothetical protein